MARSDEDVIVTKREDYKIRHEDLTRGEAVAKLTANVLVVVFWGTVRCSDLSRLFRR
jgi:hypothetical protein